MKNTSLYKHDVNYAVEHNEVEQYRESYKVNSACKEAIDRAINYNYSDNRLNSKAALKEVEEKFDKERIAYVLANTIQFKDWDERICRKNKEWAKSIEIWRDKQAGESDDHRPFIIGKAHPGLIDLFTTRFVSEYEKEAEYEYDEEELEL